MRGKMGWLVALAVAMALTAAGAMERMDEGAMRAAQGADPCALAPSVNQINRTTDGTAPDCWAPTPDCAEVWFVKVVDSLSGATVMDWHVRMGDTGCIQLTGDCTTTTSYHYGKYIGNPTSIGTGCVVQQNWVCITGPVICADVEDHGSSSDCTAQNPTVRKIWTCGTKGQGIRGGPNGLLALQDS